MPDLPTGIVTFLFTDIQGSTQLWENHPDLAGPALKRHDEIIENLVAEHHGMIVRPRGEGDSRFAVFPHALDACTAAAAIQSAFLIETWETPDPLQIRMSLHTGTADLRLGDYYGTVVNRCARLRGIAHGGQALISLATAQLVRDELPEPITLVDLGEHRLKDLTRPEHVFQIASPDLPDQFPPLKSLSTIPNNLPIQLTDFVGRGKETAEVQALLKKRRFLTLIAPGGTGKTRLAIEVGARLSGTYRDGVFFIPLAPIQSVDDILQTLSEAVQFSLSSEEDPQAQLLNYLRGRQMLLIVDNCEHVVAGLSLVREILAAAAQISVLATSREKLKLYGETVFTFSGFDFDAWETVPAALGSSAVQLFLQSAERADPDFELQAQDLPALHRIMRSVQGVPLGIILAAAWVDMLSLEEIAEEIGRSLDFLESEQGGIPDRHRSIHAAVFEYSWQLLKDDEKEIFRKLSVFRGGFTRAAAAEISEASIRSLAGLVNKSLLVSNTETRRYEVHELLRQYAAEQLEQDPETAGEIKKAHAHYFADFIEQLWEPITRHHQPESLAAIEDDIENVRRAWRFLQSQNDHSALDRMIDTIWFVHEVRGWYLAGVRLFGETLEAFDPAPTDDAAAIFRARIACGKAWFLSVVGRPAEGLALALENLDVLRHFKAHARMGMPLQSHQINAIFLSRYEEAGQIALETIALAEETGDRWMFALGNSWFSSVQMALQNFTVAEEHAGLAIEIFSEHEDYWGLTWPNQVLAGAALYHGEYDRAREHYQRLLDSAAQINFKRGTQYTLNNLGTTLTLMKDYAGAEEQFLKSLRVSADIGQTREMLGAICDIAATRFALEDLPAAVRMLAVVCVHPVSEQHYLFQTESILEKAETLREQIEEQMDPEAYAAAWSAGSSHSLEALSRELLA